MIITTQLLLKRINLQHLLHLLHDKQEEILIILQLLLNNNIEL